MKYRPRHGSYLPSFAFIVPILHVRPIVETRQSNHDHRASNHPSLRRGTKEINEGVVCAWHCYICTYIQVPVNNDGAPDIRRGGEKNHERERRWRGKNAENPGFDGDDETTTCLAMVKSSSSRLEERNGPALQAVDRRIPSTNRPTFPPHASSLCPPSSSSSSSSSRNEDPEFVRGHQSYRRFT